MNLRDLKYLVAVSEHKSFSKAANFCAISQPTLSTQIKKVEDLLGVQIFERDATQINVTPIGSEIIAIARSITSDTEKIKQLAKSALDFKIDKINMGAFPTLANYIFPEYVFRLKQHYDHLKIRLIEEKTDSLINLLMTKKIDVAFLAMPIEHQELEYVPLFEDQFFVAVYDGHPFAIRSELEMDDLMQEPLLLLDEGHCLRTQILKLCALSRVNEDDFRAASLETLRVMVKNGLGITLMPSVAINQEENDIHYIPIKSNPSRTICLCWKKYHPSVSFFRELARVLAYKPMQ